MYRGPARLGYVAVLQRMGADVTLVPGGNATTSIRAAAGPLRATEVRASEIPSLDEVPALAVAAAVAEGTTVFSDVGELRVKEVDRLVAVAGMVEAFGASARIEGDTLAVTGRGGPLPRRSFRQPRRSPHGDGGGRRGARGRRRRAQPHQRLRRRGDQLPGVRRGPRAHHGRRRGPAAASGGHRRTGGRRQVHGLDRRGGAAGPGAARHRRHVPGRGRAGPVRGHAAHRQRGGGRASPRRRPSRWGSTSPSTART